MNWRKLIRASELFQQDVQGDGYYTTHMKERNPTEWGVDEGPSDGEIRLLIKFLNQWRTHYPSDEDSRIRLKRAYVEVLPLLRLLEAYDLLEARFDSEVAGGKTLSGIIEKVF